MSSPDNLSFPQFIKIDRRKSDPIYIQIVYQFIQAVQRRLLESGDKIPGSRSLSKELNVHRKTIIAALDELEAQGWIRSVPSVGTFVKNPDAKTIENPVLLKDAQKKKKENSQFLFRKSFLLDSPEHKNQCLFQFTEGTPDYRIIKTNELGRFYTSALKRKNILKKIPDYVSESNPFFKEQLSYYLNLTRGLHISKDNMMTANSRQVLLYILTQLLVQTGDRILVGDYSYYYSNMVFQQAGAQISTIPMDQEGIQTDYIRRHFRPGTIKFVYLSPQHQFPTTVCLSENRRQGLIELANEYQFILVEDDGNYELTYEKYTSGPLIKRLNFQNLIYLGCFGKFLTPGFQTDFMIAPQDFIKEAQKHFNIFGKIDIVKEQALAEMIYEGDIHRYRRKALQTYQSRRDLFAALLKENFPSGVKFMVPKGGLAFWIEFEQSISLSKLTEKCRKMSLFIPRTCLYQNKHTAALRLGFGHLHEKEMKEALKILKEAYEDILKPS